MMLRQESKVNNSGWLASGPPSRLAETSGRRRRKKKQKRQSDKKKKNGGRERKSRKRHWDSHRILIKTLMAVVNIQVRESIKRGRWTLLHFLFN